MKKFIPDITLQILCVINFFLRNIHVLKDKWYWADVELLRRGVTKRYYR